MLVKITQPKNNLPSYNLTKKGSSSSLFIDVRDNSVNMTFDNFTICWRCGIFCNNYYDLFCCKCNDLKINCEVCQKR